MDWINTLLSRAGDFLYTYILILLLVAAGVYFSARTRGVQFRLFPEALRCLGKRRRTAGTYPPFKR